MNKSSKKIETLKIILGLPLLYLILGTILNIIMVATCILINKHSISDFSTLKLFYENKYSGIISGILDIIF